MKRVQALCQHDMSEMALLDLGCAPALHFFALTVFLPWWLCIQHVMQFVWHVQAA